MYSQGRALLERGDFSSAQALATQGFQESDHKDPVWNWKFRELSAEIKLWQSQADEVIKLLAVPPPSELENSEFAVRGKVASSLALVSFSRYKEAEKLLQEAEIVASARAPGAMGDVAQAQGTLAWNQTNPQAAEQQFRRALQFAREQNEPFIEASALGSLGLIFTRAGRFDEAIEWNKRSLAVAHSHQFWLTENISLDNLAWSYSELGDLEKAISNFNDEEKIIDSLGQTQLKQDMFSNMGRVYAAQGNYAAARASYLKAFNIADETNRQGSSDQTGSMALYLNDVAEAALQQGFLDEAETYNGRARNISPSSLEVMLTSARIALARQKIDQAQLLLQNIVAHPGIQIFLLWQAQAELANVYAARKQPARAERQFQTVLDTFYKHSKLIRDTENRLAFSFRSVRFYRDYVRFLVASGQPGKALQIVEFSRARNLAEGVGLPAQEHPADLQLNRARAFLKTHKKVVLDYWLAPDKSFLWAVTDSQVKLFTLPPERKIDQQIQNYTKALHDSGIGDLDEKDGQTLYEELVKPASEFLTAGTGVVIIADGSLSRLNFEALRVPGNSPHYWIDDVQLENTSSLALFTRPADRRHSGDPKVLLMGNPVQADTAYPSLRHAADEIQRVARHFPETPPIVVAGQAATPSSYSSIHPEQFDMLHFVTHGTASLMNPLDSAIILSSEGENSYKLYARNIIKIHLQAEVVTISACYGAGARPYPGEGLVGLAWAFMGAGAHHVIAGLWEVDDRATPELMDHLYAGLQHGKSAVDALRSAKLAMLHSSKDYNRPYYWASLQLYTGS